MHFIFRPQSKLNAPRWVARLMNALNMLGPVLLLVAIGLGFAARFGDLDATWREWLLQVSILLVLIALVIRIGWGIAVRILYRRYTRREAS